MTQNVVEYQLGTITNIQDLGEGTRVCLDFVDGLDEVEGLLIGNTGHGYMLVLAETRTTKTYPPRPFRVNGGALHQYVYVDGQTKYLSELEPGMKLNVYSPYGFREVAIGRVKLEKRPLKRIALQCENLQLSITIQDSDSVFVMGSEGRVRSAVELQEGDQLLCMPDQAGRHLGQPREGYIIEK